MRAQQEPDKSSASACTSMPEPETSPPCPWRLMPEPQTFPVFAYRLRHFQGLHPKGIFYRGGWRGFCTFVIGGGATRPLKGSPLRIDFGVKFGRIYTRKNEPPEPISKPILGLFLSFCPKYIHVCTYVLHLHSASCQSVPHPVSQTCTFMQPAHSGSQHRSST